MSEIIFNSNFLNFIDELNSIWWSTSNPIWLTYYREFCFIITFEYFEIKICKTIFISVFSTFWIINLNWRHKRVCFFQTQRFLSKISKHLWRNITCFIIPCCITCHSYSLNWSTSVNLCQNCKSKYISYLNICRRIFIEINHRGITIDINCLCNCIVKRVLKWSRNL